DFHVTGVQTCALPISRSAGQEVKTARKQRERKVGKRLRARSITQTNIFKLNNFIHQDFSNHLIVLVCKIACGFNKTLRRQKSTVAWFLADQVGTIVSN